MISVQSGNDNHTDGAPSLHVHSFCFLEFFYTGLSQHKYQAILENMLHTMCQKRAGTHRYAFFYNDLV